jgi:hypothetical protein
MTTATDTCVCGQWPLEEYGAICPSCLLEYREPHKVVEAMCAEARLNEWTSWPADIASHAVDTLAEQEGLVDAEGNGRDSQIELAYTEWSAVAERWFAEHPLPRNRFGSDPSGFTRV